MATVEALMFDWDGTLYDSFGVVLKIYNEIFAKYGLGRLGEESFREKFRANYHEFYAASGLPKHKFREVDEYWTRRMWECEGEARMFPGALEVLEKANGKGIPLGIVTNGTRERIESELEGHGVAGLVDTVVTFDDVGRFKPDPAGVGECVRRLGISRPRSLYVGDMVEDILAGKGAGVMTGAVPTGPHGTEKLRGERPTYMFARIADVLGVI
ncbi:MAG: HAD family hydrolase [Candidatus Micrarchaeota archaeon]|nr:HAD family hydrolase [Candidatus Micrarchaeota archaeon]